MLIRVRSKDGAFRFNFEPTDDFALFVQKTLETAPNADPTTLVFSNEPSGKDGMPAEQLRGSSIGSLGLTHGHLLYANYKELGVVPSGDTEFAAAQASSPSGPSVPAAGATSGATDGQASTAANKPWEGVKEDAVDEYWERQGGLIPRKRDPKMCRHGENAMCDHCMPLEPYDERYQAENNIKHLSFHAYLRKLDAQVMKKAASTSYIPPLEEPNFSVKVPCPSGSHPPWPAGICTKCQPSAVTLVRQPFRMVDHVEFSDPRLIDDLLQFWRSTATQRFGFMLGHYEPYPDVPMGIKTVVEAIHEPPQEGELDGLTLGVPWDDQGRIEALASECGLQIVGMIYTDLENETEDPERVGQVRCKRHKDSFFLSSLETIFSAHLQSANRSPSKFSMSGKFGSKFVTCVLSGTEEGGIDVTAYQVSLQAQGMVDADMIEASVEPGTVRVKMSEGSRYVPEVFYRYKNEYGIDVKDSAKPTFPVEYLLVNVTHGFPKSPDPRFITPRPFAIENRAGLHDQDLQTVLSRVNDVLDGRPLLPRYEHDLAGADGKGKGREESTADVERRRKLVELLSDWHLLVFLDGSGILDKPDIRALAKVVTTHDGTDALDAFLSTSGWQTLQAIARESAPSSARPPHPPPTPARDYPASGSDSMHATASLAGAFDEDVDIPSEAYDDAAGLRGFDDAGPQHGEGGGEGAGTRICPHCTFENPAGSGPDCEVCGLPLSG